MPGDDKLTIILTSFRGTSMKRHPTKIGLSLLLLVVGVITYFGYRGPTSDKKFLLGCLVISGSVCLIGLYFARLARCPKCDADLGYFFGIGPFRQMNRKRPRYITCKQCGQEIDRWTYDG